MMDDFNLETEGFSFTKHTILAVDDMPSLLSSVVKILEDQYNVIAVTSGSAALKVLEKYTPSLFLLDIEMSKMDGYELASTIRTIPEFFTTPIIFLTSKSTRQDVVNAIKHGGNDYVIKPINKNLLINKIQQHLS